MSFTPISREEYEELSKNPEKLKAYNIEYAKYILKDLSPQDRDLVLTTFDPKYLVNYHESGSYLIYNRIAQNFNPNMRESLVSYNTYLRDKRYSNTKTPMVAKDMYHELWRLSSGLDIPVKDFLIYSFRGSVPNEVRMNAINSTFLPERAKTTIIDKSKMPGSSKVLQRNPPILERNISNVRLPNPIDQIDSVKSAHGRGEVGTLNSTTIKTSNSVYQTSNKDTVEVVDWRTLKVNGIDVVITDITVAAGKAEEAKTAVTSLVKGKDLTIVVKKKRNSTTVEAEVLLTDGSIDVRAAIVESEKYVPKTTTPAPVVAPPPVKTPSPVNVELYDVEPSTSKTVETATKTYYDFSNLSEYTDYLRSLGLNIVVQNGEVFERVDGRLSKIPIPLVDPKTITTTFDLAKGSPKSELSPEQNGYNIHPSLLPILEYNKVDDPSRYNNNNPWPAGNYFYSAGSVQVYVDDADTIQIKVPNGMQFRFIGIDAHEKNSPAGIAAKEAYRQYISGKDLVIKTTGKRTYNREAGVIYIADTGENTNVWAVRNQWARVYDRYASEVDPELNKQLAEALAQAVEDYNNGVGPGRLSALNKEWSDPEIWRRLPGELQTKFLQKYEALNGTPFINDPDNPTAGLINENSGKPFDKEGIDYKEDENISMESEYQHLAGAASIAHLSRLYDTYYSSADVKVWIKREDGLNPVMVDLITGIGYNYQVNSMPVYTIGSRFPVFFSRGNSLGNGTIVVPFKHAKYMRAMLKYVFNEADDGASSPSSDNPSEMSDEDFVNQYSSSLMGVSNIIEVGSVVSLFDIEIRFDNSNAFARDFGKSKIILKDCKLTGDAMDIASGRDTSLQVGYSFIFKSIITGDANERIGQGTPNPNN